MISDYPELGPEIDELFPPAEGMDHRTTQTVYYSFNIPEQHLNGEIYVWLHPGLRSASAGLWVTRGLKTAMLETDYFDWRAYQAYPTTPLSDMVIGNNLRFRTIEPLRRFRFDYEDKPRRFALQLFSEGVVPPIARSNIFDFERNHFTGGYAQGGFEQIMRATGELMLDGKTYAIDCHSIRDRSWGQTRDEMPMAIPPMTWTTAVMGDDFAFMAMSYDEPDDAPELHAHFKLPEPGCGLVKGWVWRDGEMRSVKSIRRRTVRENGVPLRHSLEFTDSTGRQFSAQGILRSHMPFHGWPNLTCKWGLTEWTCQGRSGWGETQDCQWNDYTRLFTGAARP